MEWLVARLAQMETPGPSIGRDQLARGDPDVISASLLSDRLRGGQLRRAAALGPAAGGEVAGATPPGPDVLRLPPLDAAGDSCGDHLVQQRLECAALVDGQAAAGAREDLVPCRPGLARALPALRGQPALRPAGPRRGPPGPGATPSGPSWSAPPRPGADPHLRGARPARRVRAASRPVPHLSESTPVPRQAGPHGRRPGTPQAPAARSSRPLCPPGRSRACSAPPPRVWDRDARRLSRRRFAGVTMQ